MLSSSPGMPMLNISGAEPVRLDTDWGRDELAIAFVSATSSWPAPAVFFYLIDSARP